MWLKHRIDLLTHLNSLSCEHVMLLAIVLMLFIAEDNTKGGSTSDWAKTSSRGKFIFLSVNPSSQ